jgi:hypothetical protein
MLVPFYVGGPKSSIEPMLQGTPSGQIKKSFRLDWLVQIIDDFG